MQVSDALLANGFQVTLSAANVDAVDGPQFYVWVTGRFVFTESDIEVLMNVARASGQQLSFVFPPNHPAGAGISSPKERPIERQLAADEAL